MKSESEIQQLIQIEGPKFHSILMRNNSGAFKDSTGRVVRFGLSNDSSNRAEHIKSSDLIGITTIVITQEMVGKMVGVFTAIEVKDEKWRPTKKLDKRETAQKNFIDWVISRGGMAGFASSVDMLRGILRR